MKYNIAHEDKESVASLTYDVIDVTHKWRRRTAAVIGITIHYVTTVTMAKWEFVIHNPCNRYPLVTINNGVPTQRGFVVWLKYHQYVNTYDTFIL